MPASLPLPTPKTGLPFRTVNLTVARLSQAQQTHFVVDTVHLDHTLCARHVLFFIFVKLILFLFQVSLGAETISAQDPPISLPCISLNSGGLFQHQRAGGWGVSGP